MSNPNTRKSCVVPKCTSTTTNAPDKWFFIVPKDVQMRKKWIKAMKRFDPFGDKSTVYCCEDHFDIENDMENYIKYKMVGGRIKLKKGIVPHKFKCQQEKEDKPKRTAGQKRNQIKKIEKLLKEDETSALEKPEEIFVACCKDEIVIEDPINDTDDESLGNVEATSQRIETVDTNKFARPSASQPPASQVCEATVRKRKLDSINEAINKLYKISSTKNEGLDEFDHFGKFVTAQLRKMPEYEAILCQEELHSVIRKYRLRPLTVSLNNASSMSPSEPSLTTPSPTQIHIKNEM